MADFTKYSLLFISQSSFSRRQGVAAGQTPTLHKKWHVSVVPFKKFKKTPFSRNVF